MFKHFENVVRNKNIVMFVTACFFMAGILSYFNDCAIIVSLIATIILLFLNFKNYINYKYILLWAFIFYFGFFNALLRIKDSDDLLNLAPADATITGRIVSIPNSSKEDKQKFFFDVSEINGENVHAKTLVTVSNENYNFNNLNIGNEYKITGKLRAPFEASNPSQFDYGKYLRNYKTHTVFYANNEDCIQESQNLPIKWKLMQGLNNVRTRIINTHALYLKSPNHEILGGIVFGDDAVAPPDYIKDTFRNSGLLHILAASGMNVAFIYGFWYFILRRLRIPIKLIIVSGMGVIVLYTLMTGLGASVVRAALMLIFVLAGKLIDRDSHSISLLAFVASLMLLYNPAYINDVGFQLSFIVTFGLLTTANVISNKLKNTKIPDWLCAEILIPIVAQLWVIPLQMFYFNTISTYSILANIAIMPFLSIISFLGFISSLLAIIKPIAKYICHAADFILNTCLNILVNISNFFSNLDYSLIETTHPAVFQIVLYYIIILLITLMFRTGIVKKIAYSILVLSIILAASTINNPNKNLEIITFDVQNADAFLIKTPENKYFMIDTGKSAYNGGKSQAEVIILKYLKDNGIKDIEGLVITHFDNDHSGGVVDILNNIRVKNVYINTYNNDSYTSKGIYSALKSLNINTILVKTSIPAYTEKDLSINLYRPFGHSDNDNSIVTLLSMGDFQALFMGDSGVEAYYTIRKNLPKNKLEIFKVGHHGAKGVVNSTMLEELEPQVSLISTGKNLFGHPNKVTLDALRNTDIYRTDFNNSIKIVAKDTSYKVLSYNKRQHKYELFKSYQVH